MKHIYLVSPLNGWNSPSVELLSIGGKTEASVVQLEGVMSQVRASMFLNGMLEVHRPISLG